VRGIFTRTLLGWLEQRALAAAAEGSARSHSGDSAPCTSARSRSARSLLGRAPAPRLRRRRPHLPLTRAALAASSRSSPTPSSCASSSRTSDCPPSLHGPRQLAHANSSTSPEPPPFTTSRPLLARNPHWRVGPAVSNAPALPPQRASNGSPARQRSPIWAPVTTGRIARPRRTSLSRSTTAAAGGSHPLRIPIHAR
jgi:hypothetical protein